VLFRTAEVRQAQACNAKPLIQRCRKLARLLLCKLQVQGLNAVHLQDDVDRVEISIGGSRFSSHYSSVSRAALPPSFFCAVRAPLPRC
jgi:hypothetical protein